MPPQIKRKRACINVRNSDDACFAWAVVSALCTVNSDQHPDRTSSYPHYESVLNLEGINFPINRGDIGKFEKLNKISINVYILQLKRSEYVCVPSRLTPMKLERHINLLLIQDVYQEEDDDIHSNNDEDDPIRYHYLWIKNLSALITNKRHFKHKGKLFVCDRCLHYFHSQHKLDAHDVECQKKNNYKITFPQEKIVRFKNFKNQDNAPFVVYADLECLLKPVDTRNGLYQKHEPFSAAYYINCSYNNNMNKYKSFRGRDANKWFAKEMEDVAFKINNIITKTIPKQMSLDEINTYVQLRNCIFCGKHFYSGNDKAKYFDPITGM